MALNRSINNVVILPGNQPTASGQITGKLVRDNASIRASQDNTKPIIITGISMAVGGVNGTVGVSFGVSSSITQTSSITESFAVQKQAVNDVKQTGTHSLEFTSQQEDERLNLNIFANGMVAFGVGTYSGIDITRQSMTTLTNSSFIGTYDYIQVPAQPSVTSIDQLTSSSFRVNFSAGSDFGGGAELGYRIQVSSSPTFASGIKTYDVVEPISYSVNVSGLAAGKPYYVRVLAKNELWNAAQNAGSPWSESFSIATSPEPVPARGNGAEAIFQYREPSKSNLYSEKVFAEHPISLWSLDDKADYISFITEEQRDLTTWMVDGGSISSNEVLPVSNTFTNPSFESSDRTKEVLTNMFVNPSMNAISLSPSTQWKNVYRNPSFDDKAITSYYVELKHNYVLNPSCELASMGTTWGGSGVAPTRSTEQAKYGSASAKVIWTAANQYIWANTSISVAKGVNDQEIYTVSGWAKISNTEQVRIGVDLLDKNGASLGIFWGATSSAIKTGDASASWQRLSYQLYMWNAFDFSSSVASIRPVFGTLTAAQTVYIDGAMLELGARVTDYFDGSIVGSGDSDHIPSWYNGGTPHNSISVLNGRWLTDTNQSSGSGYRSTQWDADGVVGGVSMRVTPKYNNNSYGELTNISLQPNTTYTILAKLRLTSVQDSFDGLHVLARKFSASIGGASVGFTYITEAPNAVGVHEVRAIFDTKSSTAIDYFRLYNGSGQGGTDVWWDNVAIVEGVYLGGYFDGASSPDLDLLPSWNANNESLLSANTPILANFVFENCKGVSSSVWGTNNKSLKLISTSTSEPARCYITLASLGMEVGKTYTVMATARLAAPQTGNLYTFPTVNNKFDFATSQNVAGEEELRIDITVDGVDVTLDDELSFYNRAYAGNGDVWWDKICVVEGPYTGDYFDGSSGSSDVDQDTIWNGTTDLSTSSIVVNGVTGIVNGYRSQDWNAANASGQFSLYLPAGESETLTFLTASTVIITGRSIGQTITTNADSVTLTQQDQQVKLFGVTSLTLGTGWWDDLCVVSGSYPDGYFDGNSISTDLYSYSWSGIEHESTSIGTPLVVSRVSLGSSAPFIDSNLSLVAGDGISQTIKLVSPIFANYSEINEYMSSMSVGMFIVSSNLNVQSIRIGVISGMDTDLDTVYQTSYSDLPVGVSNEWVFASAQLPSLPQANTYRVFFEIDVRNPQDDVLVVVNGITAGQWSEEYQLTSLGVQKTEIPASVGVSDFYGVPAEAYGLQDENGYYIINDNMLLARNIGMPMVYGSNNTTSIFPHPDGGPSLVIPGKGFLNDLGQYRNYSAEFWLRVNADTSEPRRIFGPLASTDGLYVDGPFMTIKVGNYVGSHYVAEWYRPMLVGIVYGKNNVKLMVDGEVVVDLAIDASSLFLPVKTLDNVDQDWLGFYAYSDVPQIEVDSVSIYSYQTPPVVAKRRFIYGQGVEFPETVNSAYNGKSAIIDNTFANNTNGYRYPDLGKWIQGIAENVSIDKNVLSTPKYSLPTIKFNKQSTDAWYKDLSSISDKLVDRITLKPNASWETTEGYILFDSLNIVKQDIKAFYGIFHLDNKELDKEVLFKIEDDATKNYFLATVSGTMFNGYTVEYTIKYGPNSDPETVYTKYARIIDETIYAGIDIDRFARKFGKNLSLFFGSPRRLKVYVAGTKEFTNTFSGEISKVGFCTRRNFSKISYLFNAEGIIEPEVFDAGNAYFGNDPAAWDRTIDGGVPSTQIFFDTLYSHVASYTLFAKKYYDQFTLDIATDSYWEDYIPLTYLGKEVVSYDGDIKYGLDTIQFNIDYPRPIFYDGNSYNTSDSLIKTYISFQYISTGANQTDVSFTDIVPAPKNNVVDPGSSWINKKFEVVNNTVIYPPAGVDFKKLAIVVHLEFNTTGILSKTVKVRNLQLSSKALNANQPNKIGTKLGLGVYPYAKKGLYLDYASKNPYAIYRGSTPYLYLTKDSGIKLVGDVVEPFNRGLSVTVNQDKSSRFKLTAIQAAVMFPEKEFPTIPTPLFEIDSNTGTTQFFVVSSHPKNIRGKIYAVEKASGKIFGDALFFLNGRIVKNPEISLNEWNMFSVAFRNNLSFNGKVGSIRINGPFIFNNLSFYEETALQQARSATLRQWFGVKYSIDINEQSPTFAEDVVLPWNIWDPYTWEQILILSPNSYNGVSPVELYTTYSGTNKIVVGDDSVTRFTKYSYKVYQDVVSTSFSMKPL